MEHLRQGNALIPQKETVSPKNGHPTSNTCFHYQKINNQREP